MLKVMIVEDDLLVADMLELTVTEGGYAVCGIARTVAQATVLGERERPDLAIIDMRLANGELGTEIAARLRGSLPKLGVLYATGNAAPARLTSRDGNAVLGKPYSKNAMIRALKLVEQLVSTGSATPPFPGGFQVLEAPPATKRCTGGPSRG